MNGTAAMPSPMTKDLQLDRCNAFIRLRGPVGTAGGILSGEEHAMQQRGEMSHWLPLPKHLQQVQWLISTSEGP